MRRLAAVLIALSSLAACQTDSEFTGNGPVELSEFQTLHYARWSNAPMTRDPLYFFLLRDGRSLSVECPSSVALCRDESEYQWWQKCEARYGKGMCKLYGVYGKVVWDFDGKPEDSWTNNPNRPASAALRGERSAAPSDEDVRKGRTIVVHWEGREGEVRGTLDLTPAGTSQSFDIAFPGPLDCKGAADFRTRKWSVACADGNTA